MASAMPSADPHSTHGGSVAHVSAVTAGGGEDGGARSREVIEIPLEVDPGRAGYRLDRFLVHCFGRLSRNRVHAMIASGAVRCSATGRSFTKKSTRVHGGQAFVVHRPAPAEPSVVLDYDIIHRDPELLVLDKPAGLPVHPSARYHHNTLTALMRTRLGAGHGWEMAHRLDRETSGVMLFGRRGGSAAKLKQAFFRREIEKEYLAIVFGKLASTLEIDRPLGPAQGSKILIKVGERSVADGGQTAATRVEPLAHGDFRGREVSLIRARPRTGRTHQIRAHLALEGFPLVGDKLYGIDEERFLDVVERGRPIAELEAELGLARHALHAHRLSLAHPTDGEAVQFESPWPPALQAIIGCASGPGASGV
jgi:23S rRNA pseudouridine1911/1915/1917 synthase